MKGNTSDKYSQSIISDFFLFWLAFLGYIILRFRQLIFYLWAFIIWLSSLLADLKSAIVRRMFWGRSSFYKSAFQFGVGLMTFVIGVGGLAGRLNLFVPKETAVLAFPGEQIGDADFLDEGASMQAIVAKSYQARTFNVQTYVVQQGDTISSIAEKFGISTDTIRWANNIKGDFLKVGQELEILPINGVIHKVNAGDTLSSIAKKYEASEQDIYDINWLVSSSLKEGQELLVPNGKMPQPKIVKLPIVASKPNVNYSGGNAGTGNFIRPCSGGYISNYFSAWHGGVDIAKPGGTVIVATDSGIVTMARWYGAVGLQIMIDHKNGFVTLYAHNATLYVSEGQSVTRGQPIGYMGCTGRCTGTHLHFGVSYNGVWVNPLLYVPI